MFEAWNGTVADGDRQLVFTASILSGFLQSSVGFEPVVHFNRSIAQQRLYLPMDKKSYISLYWVITLNQGGRVPVNITLIRPSIPPQNRSVFGHCSASELYIKGTHLIDWGTKERQTPYRGSLTPFTRYELNVVLLVKGSNVWLPTPRFSKLMFSCKKIRTILQKIQLC